LIELRNINSYNDGYSYILMIIDVFSKYAWVESLRDKTNSCVIKAFQRVFSRSEGRVPVYLQTDKGKEFIARPMQKFLKHSFSSNSQSGYQSGRRRALQQNVERANVRYFTHKNTRRYIDVLQNIVRAYNHTRHSSTRMQPAIMTKENARVARENIARR